MTRIQLATGFIDLPNDTDFPIDLSFAEITKSGARSGGQSRTLEIEGTENNTFLLGASFDIDLTNDTFNRNKKTNASVIQNGVEVFDGYIQLMEVTRVNKLRGTNHKKVTFKINIFDEISNFFNQMGDKELTDLRFPEFSHIFNRTNIIASWSNTSGYTYPQYAKSDNIYTLRDFKPAIFEFEYWKKIFATNGYTFSFDQFDDNDIRLDKRIIPFNGKQSDETIGQSIKQAYTVRGEMVSANYVIDSTNTPTYPIGWLPIIDYLSGAGANAYATATASKLVLSDIFEDAQSQWSLVNSELTNLAGQGRTFQILTSYDYEVKVRAQGGAAWQANIMGGGGKSLQVKLTLMAQSTTNPNKRVYLDAAQTVVSFFNSITPHTYGAGWQPLGSGTNASFGNLGIFDVNEKFDVHVLIFGRYYVQPSWLVQNQPTYQLLSSTLVTDIPAGFGVSAIFPVQILDTATLTPVRLEFDIDISNLQFKAVPDVNELSSGLNVDVTQFIPRKIKQRDLISAISKNYNLVFVPDPENNKNIIVKTRDKYYEDGDQWDWTDKFAEDKPNNITFLNNDVKQFQIYKYKDDKDVLNETYQTEFNETYGQSNIKLDNEYTVGTDERVLIYSPTPSIKAEIGVPLPSINGINPECNLRVLLHNGVGTISQYAFHNDLLPTASSLLSVTSYNKTSMFDSDTLPNFSILFNAPKILFHGYQQGQTTNYLYNLHHQQELTTINTGSKLTAYFDLSETDFQKLSKRLDYKIFIKDNGWFFISKIHGYNSGKRTLTKVDLITADEKTRIKYKRPGLISMGSGQNASDAINTHMKDVAFATNIDLGSNNSIDGKYNFIDGDNNKIQGDQNTVRSSSVMIMGDNNDVETGLSGSKIIGDQLKPSTSGVFTGNNSEYKVILTQSATSDPVQTILKNTLGILTSTRIAAGDYELTGTGLFISANTTFITISPLRLVTTEVRVYRVNVNTIKILTYSSGVLSDGLITNTNPLSLAIEVFTI